MPPAFTKATHYYVRKKAVRRAEQLGPCLGTVCEETYANSVRPAIEAEARRVKNCIDRGLDPDAR